MHNTYFSSTIYAVRGRESFSLSFNGYSNICYERFDRTPSHCSSCCRCCGCCALSNYRVPIKPSLLNGLRQSTLLHLSARRFILGREQFFPRLPAYGLHKRCYVNEETVCNRSRRRIEGECVCAGDSRKGRESYHSFGSDDAEAVLSLLSEQSDKDTIDVKRKNVSTSRRNEAEKNIKSVSRQRNLNLGKKVETKTKGILKQRETCAIDLRRENEKSSRGNVALARSEGHRSRKDVSSCSSYYTVSSGDLGSDIDVQDKHGLEECSSGYENDEANYVKEEFNKQRDDLVRLQDFSKHEKTAFGADIDSSLRKKSEKKLAEVTVQEIKSTREQQDVHSEGFRSHEPSSYGKASLSHKQVNSKEDDDSSFLKRQNAFIQARNKRHQYTGVQDSGVDEFETTLVSKQAFTGRHEELDLSDAQLKETRDEHKKIVGSTTTGKQTLNSKKISSSRHGNLEILETCSHERSDEQKKFSGSTSTTGKDVINRSSHKYIETSKVEDIQRTSMKNLGAQRISVSSSVQGMEEHQHQKGEKRLLKREEKTEIKDMRKSQHISEVSHGHQSNIEDTSIINARTKIKNTDEKQLSSSQRTSEKVKHIPKSTLKSVAKTTESSCQTDETIVNFELSREDKTTRKVTMSDKTSSREESNIRGSRSFVSESGTHVTLTDDHERKSATMLIASSSQESTGGGSARAQITSRVASPEIIVETSESGSSDTSDHSDKSPVLLQYSRDGSNQSYSEPYTIMAPEDSLRSVDCLEKSSNQFVAEFVQRARHEVATSATSEVEGTRTKLAVEDEGNQIYNSSRQHTEDDSQSKKHDSSHSSGIRESKGPSDEMWDETKSSVEQSQRAEESEVGNETSKIIVRRTGRSLWSMIADVVKLRWVSHAASTSAERSDERNSPNKSDSETWFSGQEHAERHKSSAIKEASVISPEAITIDKLKQGKNDTQCEGEMSDTRRIKDKGKCVEIRSSDSETWLSEKEQQENYESSLIKETSVQPPEVMTIDKLKPGKNYTQSEETSDTKRIKNKGKHVKVRSSSNTEESGSVTIPYASGEENIEWTRDRKDLKISTSGIKSVDFPSASLPARGPPVASPIVNIGVLDLSRTRSVLPIKEPVPSVQSELSASGEKDGELKQRKFQRTGQVLRDRFDDWEEAYQLELEQRRMDEMFMKEALLEAKKAADIWEVPVGAVLVQQGKIIARGCNLVEELRDSTAHAEMICIREASNLLRTWRLSGTTLYVTLEPCPMCAGAILQARVDTVVWGAPNKLLGADGSWIRLFPEGGESSDSRDMPPAPVHPFHPKITIRRGILENECADVMQQFFQLRRKQKKDESPKEPSRLSLTHRHHHAKFLNKLHDIFHVFCL
ncbi:tRNA(adenine(34)) deaminase, chloroplastic [Arachis stenosperma]|uniref:tRNA(adenine(34)) deaminase, chloroplastic n=1 Tax=Arachis stenosperma TaxID=217475 RepID=UPI0025ACAB35|nr:tRNA(adenine(34)) deaminase, chloroplastic [Arachis stenosperma]XP_057759699.1 tRNA(adenine(34)) deaminase, chloroplastic [Arachis stenosperma]XP_057759700.1 tRNA(adenine(34)) deaminase, chloroplastic [Arachis stenosperma]XP_057759701.1 tRNA(adenine(34)) deaminase, chloroplastic [Arachis stenosperma]